MARSDWPNKFRQQQELVAFVRLPRCVGRDKCVLRILGTAHQSIRYRQQTTTGPNRQLEQSNIGTKLRAHTCQTYAKLSL